MVLLQVDFVFDDELEIVYEGFYEIEDTTIFAWSSILKVWHYHWLHILIRRVPPINKVGYLVRTIQHILVFLLLWTIIMA